MSDSVSGRGRRDDWRSRFDAFRPKGVVLDTSVEPVDEFVPFPTAYAPGHLLLTNAERAHEAAKNLAVAAGDFGWKVEVDGEPSEDDAATATRTRSVVRERPATPIAQRVRITPDT